MQENNAPKQAPYKVKRNPNVSKWDQPVYGFLAGLLFILIGIIGIKFLRHPNMSMGEYFDFFITFDNTFFMSEASKILSLALFALLAPFYFFLNKNCYMATRGVIIIAMIVAALIVMYKFIL